MNLTLPEDIQNFGQKGMEEELKKGKLGHLGNSPFETGEIVVYQPDEITRLDVKVSDDTVWLTQEQIALLFGVQRPAITKHVRNILTSHELEETSVCSILERTASDGKQYKTQFYNLDMILSVGYWVNSRNAIAFRRWASAVLKDYMLRGYTVERRLKSLEDSVSEQKKILAEHQQQINFFVRTSLPPVEGVFYDGQIFDAYVFVSDLIKSAKCRIVLIDNYVDESTLLILSKRSADVSAEIRTGRLTKDLQLDVQRHNSQYAPVNVLSVKNIHDRFLIVDDTVYHIGASLKDLGRKLFAFSRMTIPPKMVL